LLSLPTETTAAIDTPTPADPVTPAAAHRIFADRTAEDR
jgi:hypothetical protein